MYPMLIILLVISTIQAMPLDDDMLLYWLRSDTIECKPFTVFTIDCNKCFCGADGVSYCTKMACPKKDELKKPSYENIMEVSNEN